MCPFLSRSLGAPVCSSRFSTHVEAMSPPFVNRINEIELRKYITSSDLKGGAQKMSTLDFKIMRDSVHFLLTA